jgi:hypothetical protein
MSTVLTRQLDAFCAWYKITRCVLLFQIVLFVSCLATAVFVLLDKFFYFGIDYGLTAMWTAVPGLLVFMGYILFGPRNRERVSYLVDREAGLKNLISSGIEVEHADDHVSSIIRDRAQQTLTEQSPRKVMPLSLNWGGRYIYIPAALLIAAFMSPHFDFLDRKLMADTLEQEQAQTENTALKLKASITALEESRSSEAASIEGKKIMDDFDMLTEKMIGTSKKEALMTLGEFENKYREAFTNQRDFENMAKALDTTPDMKGLADKSKKAIEDLMKSMKEGDMGKMAAGMRDIAKQLQSEDLNQEEKQALAREMAKMAEKMQAQGGEQNQALADALNQMAGANQENLDEMIKQASDMMNDLADFAQDCDAMQQMQDALGDAKKDMLGEQAQGMDMKSVEDMMEQEAASLGEGQGQCQGPGCTDPNCPGCDGSGQGGTGGEGQGRGGQPLEEYTDTDWKKERDPTKISEGRILQQIFVKGVPEKGEALVAYGSITKAAKQEAASSLARDRIPREYEEMVKKYFDSIELEQSPGETN